MVALRPGRRALLATLLGAVACTGDPTGPAGGAIEVSAAVAGGGADQDGFLVVVSRTIQRALLPGEPVLLDPIAPGEYEVALEGIGPNCVVVGASVLAVTVVAGDTARAAFELSCAPVGGTLRVLVRTSGSDLDPNGYAVVVDGTPAALVEPDGSVLFTVAAGERTVTLGAVNPNCEVLQPVSRTLGVPLGGLATAEFEIACQGWVRAGRGHEIAYTSSDDETSQSTIQVVNDDGSHTERLFPDIPHSHGEPSWAFDGDRIAFYAVPTDETVALTIADVELGERLEFTQPSGSRSPAIAWSPDGGRLALDASIGSGFCPAIRLFRLDGAGEESLDVGCYSSPIFESLAWSPDGGRIAFVVSEFLGDNDGTLIFGVHVADFATPGESPSPPGCGFREPTQVAWSRDGSRLAVADGGIFVLDLVSATCARLTNEPSDRFPSWSPDGSRIAFSSSRDGNSEIYVMQADGSGRTRITRNPLRDFEPSWRP